MVQPVLVIGKLKSVERMSDINYFSSFNNLNVSIINYDITRTKLNTDFLVLFLCYNDSIYNVLTLFTELSTEQSLNDLINVIKLNVDNLKTILTKHVVKDKQLTTVISHKLHELNLPYVYTNVKNKSLNDSNKYNPDILIMDKDYLSLSNKMFIVNGKFVKEQPTPLGLIIPQYPQTDIGRINNISVLNFTSIGQIYKTFFNNINTKLIYVKDDKWVFAVTTVINLYNTVNVLLLDGKLKYDYKLAVLDNHTLTVSINIDDVKRILFDLSEKVNWISADNGIFDLSTFNPLSFILDTHSFVVSISSASIYTSNTRLTENSKGGYHINKNNFSNIILSDNGQLVNYKILNETENTLEIITDTYEKEPITIRHNNKLEYVMYNKPYINQLTLSALT